MGASLANTTRGGIAFKQTRATQLSAMESSSSLVLHASRLRQRARRLNRLRRAQSPHHKLDEKTQNAQERDQVGTWIETQRRSSYRFKNHEVPKFATRCRHSETGGDVVEPTHSLSILSHFVYIYITLGAVQLMFTALLSFSSTRSA